jgi:hypothetical protein
MSHVNRMQHLVVLGLLMAALSGCASAKNLWPFGNKNDDTVLPGQREDVLSQDSLPKSEVKGTPTGGAASRKTTPNGSSGKLALCEPSDPTYPECLTPDAAPEEGIVDEEATAPTQ